jgi:hypothetical protein
MLISARSPQVSAIHNWNSEKTWAMFTLYPVALYTGLFGNSTVLFTLTIAGAVIQIVYFPCFFLSFLFCGTY